MAEFKVRRKAELKGGLEVSGGAFAVSTSGAVTTGSLKNTSGSVQISASGIAIGGGSKVVKLLSGSVKVVCPNVTAASSGSANVTIADAAPGGFCFMQSASIGACTMLVGASITASNTVDVRFYNAGSANLTGTELTCNYLIINL